MITILRSTPRDRFNLTKVLSVLIVLFTFGANAQVSDYVVDQLTLAAALPTAVPAGHVKIITGPNNTGAVANAPLPFPFQFNGVTYPTGTNLNVSLNGFVTFGAAPLPSLTQPISNNGSTGVMSIYGSYLELGAGTNYVAYYHDVANGIFKIEWNGVRRDAAETVIMIMQIWLYSGTNVVEFHYRAFQPPLTSSGIATLGQVGLRGANNTDYKNLTHPLGSLWPSTAMALGTANNATVALRRTDTYIPTTARRLFRFTPVTCFAPTVSAITTFDASSATVNWTPPASVPSNDYVWEIRTSGAPGTPGAVQTGTGATSPLNITGLAGNTTYYVYVRSDCGSGNLSGWSTAQSFTTPCTPVFPYFEYFEPDETGEAMFPGLPFCTSRQVVTGNQWITVNTPEEGFSDGYLRVQIPTAGATDSWFFTRGVPLTAGTTYRLSYEYGGSTTFDELTNRMQVRYATAATPAAMAPAAALLADHNDIKDSPLTNVVNFIPTADGVYYFGFKAYSLQNMGFVYLDTIEVTLATCFAPTGLSSGAITPTSATISWTPPATVPGAGYQYYLSTSATAPSGSTTPTGTTGGSIVNLSGLLPGTTYYFWVRSNCGFGDLSGWSATSGTFTTPGFPAVSYCIPNGAGFFQDVNGITNVTIGTINNTTGIELPNYYGNYSNLVTSVAAGATVPISVTLATGFTYNLTVWVDWNNDGDFADAGEMVAQGESTWNVPTTTTMTFTVPAGATLGTHRLRVGGMDFGPLTNPCQAGNWQAFEDYTIFVTPPPAPLTVTPSTLTTCSGVPTATAVTLTSAIGNYNNYAWSPAVGVSGNATTGWTFAPTSTTVYTLTGFNTSNFQTNTTSITVNVNQPPTPITITPAGPVNVCQAGPAVQLTASGGIVSGQLIHYEGFNSGLPGTWTSAYQGAGVAANGQWQVRPNGYTGVVPPGVGWGPINSNDNTSFVITDADAAGTAASFTSRLTSPAIAISNPNFPATEPQYTSASLSFWHYFRYLSGEVARVYISNDGFTTQTLLASYTSMQGDANAFVNVIFDMTPYIGQTIQIRFEYANVTWDWGWAVDNFLITGSGTSAVTWSPTAGLYTNAAGTIPYTGGGAVSVYAMPSTNTTYTAQAITGTCATQTTVNVVVSPIAAGTVSPASQVACGTANNLVHTGGNGTVTGWQYANDVAFTAGVTNIPASASPTLTGAQIGTFAGVRYFRAVISNGGCTAYSNVVSITFNTKIWNGTAWNPIGAPTSGHAVIFQGNYTQTTGTLSACSVRVESGAVVFNSGTNLVVQNDVTVVGGSLTFQNNASLVQNNDAAVNSGDINYIRNSQPMILYDYTYWSSPVSPQTLTDLSPLTLYDKYFAFDPIIGDFVQINGNSLMEPGTGYIIRTPQNFTSTPQVFVGTFIGTPNNGIIDTNIISPTTESYNLIGNPYPSAIDADEFYNENSTLIDGNFYFWTHNTPIDPLNYTQSDYAQWNSVGGIGTAGGGVGNTSVPNGTIAAGQGFFVVGDVVTAGSTLTFNNFMRLVGQNGNFYRPSGELRQASSAEKHRIWLEVTNDQGAYKQALVGYVEGATNEKEKAFDGVMADGGNIVALYSIVDDYKLGIQGRALPFDVNDQVPLGFRTTVAGTYSIGLSNFDGLFDSQDIYLEDLYLGIIHDLKTSNYTFATTTGEFDDRFMLRYTDTALGVGHFDDNAVVVYKNHSGINIHTGSVDMSEVKIFDIRGRLVTERTQLNTRQTVVSLDVPQQVLIVQVTSVDGRTVTKKIIY